MIFFNENIINLFANHELNCEENNTSTNQTVYIGEFIDKTSFYKIEDFIKKTNPRY
ncbi:MAG: hypothetical protein U9N10_04805 [Bacillota bacterium]|nr:hypothetical protein [Bacillota bacterium]